MTASGVRQSLSGTMPAPPPRSDFVSSSSHGLPLFAASSSGASVSAARASDAGSPVLPVQQREDQISVLDRFFRSLDAELFNEIVRLV